MNLDIVEENNIPFGNFNNKTGNESCSARFVIRFMTKIEKQHWVEKANSDDIFFKSVIIDNETCVYGYDADTKAQSPP